MAESGVGAALRRRPLTRLFPAVTLALMLGPVAAGLVGTLLPAFGWLPALGGETFGVEPFRELSKQPGLGQSLVLSVSTGFAATLISLCLAIGFVAAGTGTVLFRRMGRLVSPMLAVPHVTLALGLAFLIAPSGWLVRLVSPGLTGWVWPPDLLIVHDPYGISMVLGLILKETPFLFLMILAASDQVNAAKLQACARSLGYAPMTGWLKVVLPNLYPRIRLPVFAVLAYSASVVDVALILGPTTPAPLAVRVIDWATHPDLDRRFLAAAGALLQIGVVAGMMAVWLLVERLAARLMRSWITGGRRGHGEATARGLIMGVTTGTAILSVLSLAGLAIWSVAEVWRFPDAWPSGVGLETWMRADWTGPLLTTLTTAALATAISLVLVIGCLEAEVRTGRQPSRQADILLYIPLLVPQVAFLFGVQVLLVTTRLDGSWLALVWSHMVFVLPYVFLSLAESWRRFDKRWVHAARTLGEPPLRVLFRVTIPMLTRPILTAIAVGVAVSVAQYLPTVFAGAGRLFTLTTEAVTQSSGSDRRIIGVYGLLQMGLPLIAFLIAQYAPMILFRNRRALAGAL